MKVLRPRTKITELCFYWSRTQTIVEKCHPDKAVVNRNINLFSDNVIDHFRKIMKNRQYQTTLERRFSKKSKPNELQFSTSGVKRKIEQTSEAQ